MTLTDSGKSYGRKPYIAGDSDDYLSQMSRVPRTAIENQENGEAPRSVFDKPYLTDNYSEMEQFQPPPMPIPNPLRPTYPDPPIPPGGTERGDNPVPPPTLPDGTCRISLQTPFKCCPKPGMTCRDREGIFKFAHARVSIIDMNEHPPQGGRGNTLDEIWNTAIKVLHNGASAQTTYTGGGTWPLCIQSTRGDGAWRRGDTLYAYLVGSKGRVIAEAKIRVSCFDDANCCDCNDLPEGPLAFDNESTPDTIVKGSSIMVYVTGGCPPFTFATSSLGYTFNGGVTSFETENRSATLSCADGVCGVNFAVTCSFTITDNCGTVVSGVIRNTSGSWGAFVDFCEVGVGGSLLYRYGNIVPGTTRWRVREYSWSGNYLDCGTCSIIANLETMGFPNTDGISYSCAYYAGGSYGPAGNKINTTLNGSHVGFHTKLKVDYATWTC